MSCPRCGAELIEHEPDREWNRYFRCMDCLADFSFIGSALLQGKTRSAYWNQQHASRGREWK